MTPPYRLHYAPDNASLVIRLALEERGLDHETLLVDRTRREQASPGYRALNPNGLIPVLETPQGPLFETGAILLWLADTHGGLGPAPTDATRGAYLKWLFFLSNTLHADMRMMFYPELFAGDDPAARSALRRHLRPRVTRHLGLIDTVAQANPDWLDPSAPSGSLYYLACLMRWMALYPQGDRIGIELSDMPALDRRLALLEDRPAVHAAQVAEGLGATPFTSPDYANPPHGSAT